MVADAAVASPAASYTAIVRSLEWPARCVHTWVARELSCVVNEAFSAATVADSVAIVTTAEPLMNTYATQ